MNIAAPGVDSGMDLHPVIPLVALFGLMHFRIAFTVLVLRGTRSIDDGCIHDRSAMHDQSCLLKAGIHIGKDLLADMMLLQKMTEL